MDKTLAVKKSIHIKVTPEKVWHALTDRETISKYFFGTEAISDWKVGSSLVFQGEWDGQKYQDKGNILAADTGKLLQYDYWSGFTGLEDIPENYSLVTYKLEADDEGTRVDLTQEGFTGEEAKTHSDEGWTMVLENLKQLLVGE